MRSRVFSFLNPFDTQVDKKIEDMKQETDAVVGAFMKEQKVVREVVQKYDGHISRDILRAMGWEIKHEQ